MPRQTLHVAAAVIENHRGEILLARRPEHLDQGGLWEFPGGKVEQGEAVWDALQRELQEELGIQASQAHPLISIPWSYPERDVRLDVWRVSAYTGEAHGAEGQQLAWVPSAALREYRFPAANAAIVTAAQLPHRYYISPEPGEPVHWPVFLQQLEQTLQAGARILQLRAKQLDPGQYARLAGEVIRLCRAYGTLCLLNAPAELVLSLGADGVHLDSQRLHATAERPLPAVMWVAASCHTENDLRQAGRIGASFALMSPVKPTASHPGEPAMGWDGFAAMAAQATIPLYALGGMQPGDEYDAWQHGGQGIAAIRALWPS